MFTTTVTDKDGNQRQVVSDNKEDLQTGVDAVKSQSQAPVFDINVPVKKGFDLLDASSETGATDGTGVHNSPRDAVRDNGKMEGNDAIPFVVPSPGNPVTVNLSKVVADGKVADLKAEDVAKADEAQVVNGRNPDGSLANATPKEGEVVES